MKQNEMTNDWRFYRFLRKWKTTLQWAHYLSVPSLSIYTGLLIVSCFNYPFKYCPLSQGVLYFLLEEICWEFMWFQSFLETIHIFVHFKYPFYSTEECLICFPWFIYNLVLFSVCDDGFVIRFLSSSSPPDFFIINSQTCRINY